MSSFDVDPHALADLSAPLHRSAQHLTGATTVPSPDTGGTTGATRAAVDRLTARAAELAGAVHELADDLRHTAASYDEADLGVADLFRAGSTR